MAKTKPRRKHGPKHGLTRWHLLLLVPIVAAFWVPFYNSLEPSFIGVPFFYWYQLLWVLLAAAITAVVYFITE